MMTCLIIEDQPHAQSILQKYISDTNNLKLQGTFGDALEALQYLKEQRVDVIFLDIHLPKLSGIDFLSVLHPHPKIIFTTAFSDYAIQGYELNAVDYLLKPFSFKRFLQAVAKVEQSLTAKLDPSHLKHLDSLAQPKEVLFIKSGSDYFRIEINSIRYIKANGDYTWVFTTDSKYLASQSLKYWLQKLPTHIFCQVHKSYIVNVFAVQKVSNNQVYVDQKKLPIGRTFRAAFFTNFLDGNHT